MGRRSVSSTKAGKFMNPTDQARKEARRKELKKNKKQRLEVRKAVIKQKDPRHLFTEMEAIDKIEYDTNNPPPYNVKVLQEKRRKLKENWLKIYQFYQREDPKIAGELKGLEVEYERKRHQLATIYESVIQAQKVKLDDIPLPSANMLPPGGPPPPPHPEYEQSGSESVISGSSTVTPKSILKFKEQTMNKEPPGPPSGPPPSLTEFECDNDEYELGLTVDEAYKSQEKPKKIRFDSTEENKSKQQLGAAIPPPAVYHNQTNQSMISRTVQPPPPPPPSSIPTSQTAQYQQISKSIQQQITNSKIVQPQQSYYQQQQQQRYSESTTAAQQSTTPATIFQAKPVLRNKMAEITRFVPTSLQVKRTDIKKQPTGLSQQQSITSHQHQLSGQQQQGPFNYMLQQQQQYATLNPLNTYKSSLSASSNYSSALIPTQVVQQQTTVVKSSAPIISSLNAPTATRIDPKDATYESFMKEIGKLL